MISWRCKAGSWKQYDMHRVIMHLASILYIFYKILHAWSWITCDEPLTNCSWEINLHKRVLLLTIIVIPITVILFTWSTLSLWHKQMNYKLAWIRTNFHVLSYITYYITCISVHVDGFNTENGGNHFSGQFKTNINFIEVFARISYICIISIVPQLLSDVCIFIYISVVFRFRHPDCTD